MNKFNYEIKYSSFYNKNILNQDVEILSLVELNNALAIVVNTPEINLTPKTRKNLQKYLYQNFDILNVKGGYTGLVSKQVKLINKYKDSLNGKLEKKDLDSLTEDQKLVKLKNLKDDENDLSAMHRFCTIMQKLTDLKEPKEKNELLAKISEIVNKDKAESFFSDIFELYIYFILKNKGVDIQFLKSQKIGKNNKSTCDYKINDEITADCKCLISKIDKKTISDYLVKIQSQIESTLGYEGINIGGGIICFKDQLNDFLLPLRKYSCAQEDMILIKILFQKISKYNSAFDNSRTINEFHKIAENIISVRKIFYQFIEEVYSELFDNIDSFNQIKFLIMYYIPMFEEIKLNNLNLITPDSITTKFDFLFMIITHHATDEEFKKIRNSFDVAVPGYIRFKIEKSF